MSPICNCTYAGLVLGPYRNDDRWRDLRQAGMSSNSWPIVFSNFFTGRWKRRSRPVGVGFVVFRCSSTPVKDSLTMIPADSRQAFGGQSPRQGRSDPAARRCRDAKSGHRIDQAGLSVVRRLQKINRRRGARARAQLCLQFGILNQRLLVE